MQMNVEILIFGSFFCYGIYTIQRSGFLLDNIPNLWKRLPNVLHEPLFSCGICVSSIWGIFFLLYNYLADKLIPIDYIFFVKMPIYIISFCGVCAVIDRAVKYYEYGYKYTNIKPLSNYSYLENYTFRDNMIDCFLQEVLITPVKIVEVGGLTERLMALKDECKYISIDKHEGKDIADYYIERDYFVLIKGISFEGNFDQLLSLLSTAKGFIIEGSLAGDSGRQLKWVMDTFTDVVKMPYITNTKEVCPNHCAGNINNRVILIKPL